MTVPDEFDPCAQGDIVISTTALVSANPFGASYPHQADASHNGVDEHFGWSGIDGDAQALSDWSSDGVVDGTGDTIVYLPTAGWIDHFYFVDTSPDAFGCADHPSPHSNHHNHGPTGLAQDDHLWALDTHSGPGGCGS